MVDEVYPEIYPVPFISLFMEGCVENGRDLTQGAVKYNFTSINACGMANVADSLAVIRDGVFQKKALTLSRLTEMLKTNYDHEQVTRLQFRNKYPKFGNDEEEVDRILKDLCERFSSAVSRFTNPRQGPFQSGFYTVDSHVPFGEMTGALPDGRLAGKVLANSFSPVQGMDQASPTAVIKSVTKSDHHSWGNGMVLDVKISPSVLSNEDGVHKLKDLIKTYFHLGGMEIQINVITNELLKKAKEHPDEYRNLVVRVSGFSAYFTALEENLQNEIIERTEHQM
jgi:formate C-acetyltransferase